MLNMKATPGITPKSAERIILIIGGFSLMFISLSFLIMKSSLADILTRIHFLDFRKNHKNGNWYFNTGCGDV